MPTIDRNKHKWLLNRLKCMSIEEMGYRAKKQLGIWLERRQYEKLAGTVPAAPEIGDGNNWVATEPPIGNDALYLAAARDILEGRLTIFQLDVDAYDIVQSWNSDPKTRTRAPLTYGKTLDYRNENLVGEIKYLWEPNRHLHLVALAQAYCLSGRDVYLRGINLLVRSWLDQCPYLCGPNWSSSLEVAIRLINWSIVWQLIGGNASKLFDGVQGETFRVRWLSSIFRHMEFISGYFSRYSSANNHLIGEAAGLSIACNTWPFHKKIIDRWRTASQKLLIEEALKQNHPDGVNCEQAIAYQQFVLDFLIMSFLSGKATGLTFPDSFRMRIEKMIGFIAAMMDIGGNLPMIGDADDGYVVRLSQEPDFCPYRSLLATGAVLFNRPDFLQPVGKIDDKTRWILGAEVESASIQPSQAFSIKKRFPEGGYYILGSDLGAEDEIRCLIDCGPLGYLSIAAHGHADALSLCLSAGGREFLIDTGTYCYHSQKRWREYFRGTSAHNTVRIDGVDQSVSAGNFMWTHQAVAQAIKFETAVECDTFEGLHDGYMRLDDPVTHIRKVILKKRQKKIYVMDTISCLRKHVVERFWHFHEACKVKKTENCIVAQNDGFTLSLSADGTPRTTLHFGDDALPLGWVSRRYDLKVPGYTAVMTDTITGTTTLQTEINIQTG